MNAAPGLRTSSLWMETSEAGNRTHPPLRGDLRVAVCVVGAGITGLSAALELRRRGHEVAVVDRSVVGGGTSGFTTAKLSALHGGSYQEITRMHGRDAAAAFARVNLRGLERIRAEVAGLGIDCDLRERPSYLYAAAGDGERPKIEDEHEAARAAGLAVELVDDVPLPYATQGAVRLGGQAEFHPRRYLAALADELVRLGVTVHERTHVVALRDGAPVRLETEAGPVITADHVVLATHVPFPDRALFFARMSFARSYAVALRIAEPPPEGMLINFGRSATRSIRSHPVDGREMLIVGGEGHEVGEGLPTAEHYENLERFAREHWTVQGVEHRWSAQDAMPSDAMPYVGRLTPRTRAVWTATGYRKWGLALGAEAGAMLAAAIDGEPAAELDVLTPNRRPPLRSLTTIAKERSKDGFHFVADRLRRRGSASAPLAPGEGRIVSRRGRQLAVSRDDDGVERAVSARCTHLGCIVAYNDAERTWDCPCHGSRFALGGEVLEGPATSPLAAEPRR